MKHVIVFALLIQLGHTSTLTLKNVLHSANNNNSLTKAVEQERLHMEARNQADTSLQPMQLYGTGTRAYPIVGDDGYEYSVGLSQQLSWGNTQQEDQQITRLNNEASLLDEDKKILNFENGLKNLYHQKFL